MNDDKIFSVIHAETDEFETLVHIADLNPEFELTYCDFSGVDFGSFSGEVLNLTGCKLNGADLSRIKPCTLILDGAITDGIQLPAWYNVKSSRNMAQIREKVELLKRALLIVHRYVPESNIPERVADAAFLKMPVCAYFERISEQDRLTSSIISAIEDAACVYLEGITQNEFAIDVFLLESKGFSITGDMPRIKEEDDIHQILERTTIIRNINIKKSDNKTIINRRLVQSDDAFSAKSGRRIVILSGLPYIARAKLASYISPKNRNSHTLSLRNEYINNIIFIMPSGWNKSFFAETRAKEKFIHIWPNNVVTENDISTLIRRVSRYNESGLHLSKGVELEMMQFIGRSLSELKNYLLNRIMQTAKKVQSVERLEI